VIVMTSRNANADRILTRRTVRFLLTAVGSVTSFYLLLTVVPTYASRQGDGGAGGGDEAAAGLATGVLMLATVVSELAAPRLIARYGRRRMFAASLILLGAPAILLTLDPLAVLPVCALRGLGFGMAVVLGSSWMAVLVPAERRGQALGVYGVAVGIPAIAALPLGVWLADHIGYPTVFVAGGVVALLGLFPLAGLPGGRPDRSTVESLGVVRGLRSGALLRPALVFAATASAAGIVVTFLPTAVTGGAVAIVAPALLAHSAASTLGRWFTGRYAGRHAALVLALSAVVSAGGVLCLALTGRALAVVAGAAIFGLGFGAAQNASITLMFDHVEPSGYDTASAVWNIGYDAGMGLGAAGFGLLAGYTGFPLGFVLAAALIPASLILLRTRGRSTITT
jgi:MFS family permease